MDVFFISVKFCGHLSASVAPFIDISKDSLSEFKQRASAQLCQARLLSQHTN